jgi:[ribosomal protein S18]-alanine N-acetyltransferase
MIKIDIITAIHQASFHQKKEMADFLVEHLDKYGDPHEHIMQCLDFALSDSINQGGFVVIAREENAIVGALVMNKTGMSGYIPENILVYLAVDCNKRGKGIGKEIMKAALEQGTGDVALHVEPDNPARRLYESLGFTNKYLEMRLKKS